MVSTLRQWRAGEEAGKPRTGAREGASESSGESWRTHNADRRFKKIGKSKMRAEKREFVSNHVVDFGSVQKACKAVELAPSSYYYRKKSNPIEKLQRDADLRDLIEKIQLKFPQYGVRRVHMELKRHYGMDINRKRVQRIMQKFDLKALIWRGFKIKTTDSDHDYGYAPNRIRGIEVTQLDQVWVADITYIRIKAGFVYLATVMDLYSRKIVGWSISDRIDAALCRDALMDAIEKRNPKPGLIHHSDRGVQYACDEYKAVLEKHGILPSMSAQGYCYDNAFMESFFKTLKAEEVYLTEYETKDDVLKSIPEFIENVYNKKRLHSSLGYYSPVEYEKLAGQGKKLLKKMGAPTIVQVTR
jgi:putative transposase